MKHVEKGLHAHFAALQQNATTSAFPNARSTLPTTPAIQEITSRETFPTHAGVIGTPFAKVNSVVNGSPADYAGLKMGDTIRHFGEVNWENHEHLSRVAEVVQQNEGVGFTLRTFCTLSDKCIASFRGPGGQEEGLWPRNYGAEFAAHPETQLGRPWPPRLPSCPAVIRIF